VNTPQEAGLAMEFDRPPERELRAENPILADISVSEAACVPCGLRTDDSTDDWEAVVSETREGE
jgi:hypothetical protein